MVPQINDMLPNIDAQKKFFCHVYKFMLDT